MDLVGRSINEIQSLLKSKDVSAVEIAKAHYEQIESVEKIFRAFNHLTKELALTQAQHIDEKIRNNEELPPLAGVPVAIKDNMCVAGYPTACGSKILELRSIFSIRPAVQELFQAGALLHRQNES